MILCSEWQKTAWESSFYKEKTGSVIYVDKGQHTTDSVGIVHVAADDVVRPIFYNVVNTVFLLSVSLIPCDDQIQTLKEKMKDFKAWQTVCARK